MIKPKKPRKPCLVPAGVMAVLILALVVAAGCASMVPNAYKILGSAKVSYEGTMSAARDAYDRGIIGDDEKAQIIDYGNKFWVAYQSAVTALESYKINQSDENKDELAQTLASASAALSTLLDNWHMVKGD